MAPETYFPLDYARTGRILAAKGYTPTLVRDLMKRAVRNGDGFAGRPPVAGGLELAYDSMNHFWYLTRR